MSMFVALKASNSLSRLRLLPISPFEVLFILSETWEFPFLSKFSTVLEFYKFSEILLQDMQHPHPMSHELLPFH